MDDKRFDPKKLHKLNNSDRLLDLPPQYIWEKLNLPYTETSTFIDIGAGTGFFSIPFADYIKKGRLFACDISDIMIDWMKKNISSKYPNIIPLKMEEYSIPLENEVADLVFMINLHHEINEPELLLKESYRLLKCKGKIFIADWKKEDMMQGPPTQVRCEPEQVEKQMIDAGFIHVIQFIELPKHFLIMAYKV